MVLHLPQTEEAATASAAGASLAVRSGKMLPLLR
jgi:hypothetical protein